MLWNFGRAAGVAAGVVVFNLASAYAEIPAAVNTGKSWKVYKDHWSAGDEAGYGEFVQKIGRRIALRLRPA